MLFVFVFLLGLASCDNRKDTPKCEEIKGINGFASKKGDLSLPKDISAGHTRANYPEYKKYENYTGTIKVCDKSGLYQYGNYVNGKLNGKLFTYRIDDIGMFNDFSDFNIFKIFRKPKLVSVATYKNGENIKYISFDNFTGKKTYEEIYVDNRFIRKYFYNNGQVGHQITIINDEENTPGHVTNNYWDKNGNKASDWPGISNTKKNIFDFIGLTITPFSLFLIFILYKRKKKLKK